MKIFNMIQKEDGIVLVASVVTLMILSLVGVFAINTSVMENRIAGNIKAFKKAFYNTEAATRRVALALYGTNGTKIINGTLDMPDGTTLNGIFTGNAPVTQAPDDVNNERKEFVENALAEENLGDGAVVIQEPSGSGDNVDVRVKVMRGGTASGSSLGIGSSHNNSSRHRFFIFGRTAPNGTLGRGVLIEIGFLKKIRG